MTRSLQQVGEELWKKAEKAVVRFLIFKNADLFSLGYGSLVIQMVQDLEDLDLVNAQLTSLYFIGLFEAATI